MPSVKLSPSTRIRGRVLVSGTCRILSSRNPRLLVTNGYDALPQCRSQVQLGSSACWRTGSPMKQVLCGLIGGLDRRIHAVHSQSRARNRNKQTTSATRSKLNLLGSCRRGDPGTDSSWVSSFAVKTSPLYGPPRHLATMHQQCGLNSDERGVKAS